MRQDVPPLLPVRIMRTLQASLDLDEVKSGHTAIRADHFDPNGCQFPEIGKLCKNGDQGFPTNYLSAIADLHQRLGCSKGP